MYKIINITDVKDIEKVKELTRATKNNLRSRGR